MSDGKSIVREFIQRLRSTHGLSVKPSLISQNVIDVTGGLDCLLYIKGRGEAPYKWGVTANVINRLCGQSRQWFVILLYESAETGYVLTPLQIAENISHVWPLGRDGDYKPSSGTYLNVSSPFSTFKALLTTHLHITR